MALDVAVTGEYRLPHDAIEIRLPEAERRGFRLQGGSGRVRLMRHRA